MVIRSCLLLGMMLVAGERSYAASLAPEQAVALATKAMREAGVVDAAPVAPSRPLPPCNAEVSVAPRQGRWSTVELTCATPAWTRALRTHATQVVASTPQSAPAEPVVQRTALGLKRTLGKGAVISAGDLVELSQDNRAPEQIYTDPAALIGRRLRQSLAPGRPILARHLEPDWIVEQEGPVVILSQTGGISISVAGRAQSNAALGDLVSVTNLSSGRSVMARVIGKDMVAVTLKPSGNGP
jgi:flagellar basal body P-ring formation protein FlgA